jgi:hypothetical protein
MPLRPAHEDEGSEFSSFRNPKTGLEDELGGYAEAEERLEVSDVVGRRRCVSLDDLLGT